jgi:hypothetical protein
MALNYIGAPTATQPSGFSQGFQALFGNIPIGWDTSGNFAMSVAGVAVRRPDGTWIAKSLTEDRLLDVSGLILPVSPCVLLLPSSTVSRGDLILASYVPLSVMHVIERRGEFPERVVGIDLISGDIVEHCRPLSFFPFENYFVKVVSLFDLFRGQEESAEKG